MIAETILIVLVLGVLAVASIFDLRTREIPDYFSYGLIVGALGIRLLYSLYTDLTFFLYGLAGFVVMFLIGMVMYQFKQWGGGDSKLLMGLGAAFGGFLENVPLLLVFAFAVLILGGVYAFIWGLVIFARHHVKARPLFMEYLRESRRSAFYLGLVTALLLLALFIVETSIAQVLLFYLLIFIKVVEKVGFLKVVPVDALTEGDWLAKDVRLHGKLICSAKHPSLTRKHIERIKKFNIDKVWIKVGIPFVPAIFISTVVSVVIYYVI